jgi:hypothetical protein
MSWEAGRRERSCERRISVGGGHGGPPGLRGWLGAVVVRPAAGAARQGRPSVVRPRRGQEVPSCRKPMSCWLISLCRLPVSPIEVDDPPGARQRLCAVTAILHVLNQLQLDDTQPIRTALQITDCQRRPEATGRRHPQSDRRATTRRRSPYRRRPRSRYGSAQATATGRPQTPPKFQALGVRRHTPFVVSDAWMMSLIAAAERERASSRQGYRH